jgi:hypothetical protein
MAGVLFLVAMGSSVLGGSVVDNVLGSSDYLQGLHDSRNVVVTGVILELVNCGAVVGIAVVLFPILRKYSEAMATGYVGFRVVEATLLAVAATVPLALMGIGSDYAGLVDASSAAALGDALRSAREAIYGLMVAFAFGIGAFLLYSMFYGSRLVPRFISIWGLVGVACVVALNVLNTYRDVEGMDVSMILAIPIITNEIFLGFWLILKGFNNVPRWASSAEVGGEGMTSGGL